MINYFDLKPYLHNWLLRRDFPPSHWKEDGGRSRRKRKERHNDKLPGSPCNFTTSLKDMFAT